MTASVVRPDVVRFVQDVRAALDDLAPDEVEDLTEGLTADLSDALGQDGVDTLGDPLAYAAELRAAAGLPPRAAPGGGGTGPARLAGIATLDRRALDAARERLDQQPWWPAVRDFLVVLRPAWWVARGWAFWSLLRDPADASGHVLPTSGGSLLVLVLFVVASVELGRRSAGMTGGWQVVRGAVDVLAVLCLLLTLTVVTSQPEPPDGSGPPFAEGSQGLWANGQPVRDVFAYDEQGRLLPLVQLYDQDGRPLDLDEGARSLAEADGRSVEGAPAVNADGRQLWNVFPVRRAVVPEVFTAEDGSTSTATPTPVVPAPPFRSVAPVLMPGPSPSVTPSGSPSPSAAPTPSRTR